MRSWIGVGEAVDLSLQVVHHPAVIVFRSMEINRWATLVWHGAALEEASGFLDCTSPAFSCIKALILSL